MPKYAANDFSKKVDRGKKNLKLFGKLATTVGVTTFASYKDSSNRNPNSDKSNVNPSVAGCLIGLLFFIIGFVIAFALTDNFTDGAIAVVLSSAVGFFIFYFMSKASNQGEHKKEEQKINEITYHPEQLGDEYARFALVQEGKRTLFVIGLNPSTADAQKPDPTMQSVLRIAAYNGFDGFIMLNLYPFRAAQPYNLPKEFDPKLHEENLKIISELLKDRESIDVWLAFGANITKREYLKHCFEDIVKVMTPYNPKWYYINNLTKDGYPPHPLYQSVDYFKNYPL